MVEDYVEAQKSVMNAVFNSSNPYYENANRVFSYWFSPRVFAEIGPNQLAILSKTSQQQLE